MALTSSPAFHHADSSTPELQWRQALAATSRPLLNLDGVELLVVVAAHPDDETLMAGGLIAVAHRRGITVDVVVATDGEASHPQSPTHGQADLVALRRLEVTAALHELAPGTTHHPLGLGDGMLHAQQECLVRVLVDIIGTRGATTLLVSTWRGDGHTDHEAAAMAAASAAWRTDARFLEAPIWLWHWGSPAEALPHGPSLVLPAEGRHAKHLAMQQHRSQVGPLSEFPGDEAILSPAMLSHFERNVEVFFDGSPGEENPFEALHTEHRDPWQVHSSFYEARKRALTLAALPRPTYRRVLELGCSVGALAADLAGRAGRVLAVDESLAALRRAAPTLNGLDNVELAHLQVPEGLGRIDADLVVMSEIGYFLSPGRLRALAHRLRLSGCGTVVACHWRHNIEGWPLDGPSVHAILRECLGMRSTTTIDDGNFVLDVFSRGAERPA